MIRRTILSLALAGAAVLGLAATARANDTVSVAVGQRGAWDTMVVQQGIDAGTFRRENIDLSLSFTAGGPDTIQAVATGAANFGIGVGTTSVIAAYAKGAPVRIASSEFTGQNDLYLYVKSDSPIKSFADLSGKSIGFTRPGSSTYVAEHVLAAQYNVQPNYVATGEMSATLTQVMSGQIDVGWAVAPTNFDLINDKKIRIIARGSDAKALAGQTTRVNIANAAYMKDHRDVAVRFWRAYAATLDWMYKNPRVSLGNLARYNDLSIDIARAALPYFSKTAVQLVPVSQFDKSVEDAVTYKFIPKPLDADQSKGIFDIVLERH